MNAKYSSVFFRPWILLAGTVGIPHLEYMGYQQADLQKLYASGPPTRRPLRGKQSGRGLNRVPIASGQQRGAAWDE